MDFSHESAEEIINLAEILSATETSPNDAESGKNKPHQRKKISKTSMLIAILGSLSVMVLMEIVTAIYKNLSAGNFGCAESEYDDKNR